MAGDRRRGWLARYNAGYKLLAVCLAVMLWYYVAGQENPLGRQSFTLTVEPRNLPAQLVVMGALPQVTVNVSGARDLVQSLQDKDIHAYVDLSDQGAGAVSLPVQAGAPDNVRVLSVNPQTVRLTLEDLVEKKTPVKVVLQGTPAPGFMTLNPAVTPAQVTVSGPRSLLAGLQEVQAVVNAAGINANVTANVPLKLAQQYEKLSVNPKAVDVVVSVVPSGPVKTLPVIAAVSGAPGPGIEVRTVVVEPALVELTGSSDALSGLTGVSTQPVDVSGAVDRVVKEVGLALPSGVYPVSQAQVRVTVELGVAGVKPPQQ